MNKYLIMYLRITRILKLLFFITFFTEMNLKMVGHSFLYFLVLSEY